MNCNESTAGGNPAVLTPRDAQALLSIGNTSFWQGVRDGTLPRPDFYVGKRSPRWLASNLLAHLTKTSDQTDVEAIS